MAGRRAMHPCRKVQESLRAATSDYAKVIVRELTGSQLPFLRRRASPGEAVREATGDVKLPALRMPDGTSLHHSKAILSWIRDRPSA